MIYYAVLDLMIDLIDEAKSTDLFQQSEKDLATKLQNRCIIKIQKLYKLDGIDDEFSVSFNKVVQLIDNFIDSIKTRDLDVMILLFEDLKNGNISIIDENKHNKMINQLDKL